MTHPEKIRSNTRFRVFSLIGLTLLIAASMILFYGPTDNWMWDPSFYYALLRSPVIDGDLEISAEVTPSQKGSNLDNTAWPIGPSILWSPFFLAAHGVVSTLKPDSANGLSYPYIALVSFGSALYGGLGIWVLYKTCRLFADRFLALVAALLCIGATPLFFYVFRQPIMSHSVNFFAYACLIYIYLRLEQKPAGIPENQSGLLLGAFAGLCLLTRWSGILMLVFPLVFFSSRWLAAFKEHDRHRMKTLFIQLCIFAIVFFVAVSPQMMFWYQLLQKFIISPQGSVFFVDSLWPVNLLKIFIHTNRGLIYWTPFIFLGLIGLFWFPDRKVKFTMLAFAAMVFLLYGYRTDWYGGGGFGTRFLIELLPVVAIGFIFLWKRFQLLRVRNRLLVTTALFLVVHQFVLLHAVEHGIEPGWVNLTNYTTGRPVGLRFQLESLWRLVREPGLLLSPRPAVLPERQTLLVSFIHGVRNIRTYLIPGIGLLAAITVLPLLALLEKIIQKTGYRGVALVLLLYLVAAAVYLSAL